MAPDQFTQERKTVGNFPQKVEVQHLVTDNNTNKFNDKTTKPNQKNSTSYTTVEVNFQVKVSNFNHLINKLM